MSIHGGKIRGKDQIKKGRERKEFCGRLKEVCPLCECVQQYLSTHLRRYHKLDNQSSEYRMAMSMARPYKGINREIEWDAQLHRNKKRKKRVESDDSNLAPSAEHEERSNHALQVLVNELPSTDSD